MGWIRGATIGRGSQGTVSIAIPTTSTSNNRTQLFVVKSSEISNSDSLRNEKQVLTELGNNHPHIIKFLGDSSSYEDYTRLYNLFFEYANNGSLSDHLKRIKKVELPKVKKYAKGILEGLCYMHEKGYIHSDIKLQNILLCSDNVVKISDFGLSKRVFSDDEAGKFRGTPLYMSPEILAGGEVGSPADIWAVGCAVVEMVSGATVWGISPESDVSALFYRVGFAGELPVLPQGLGCEGVDFVEKCFVKDPNERWSARMLLTHPFLSGLSDPCCCEVDFVSPRCPFEFPELESSLGSGLGLGLGLGLSAGSGLSAVSGLGSGLASGLGSGYVSPRCPFEFPEMESGLGSGSGLGLGSGLCLGLGSGVGLGLGYVSPKCPFEFSKLESGLGSGSGLGLGSGLNPFGGTDVVESREWKSVLRRFENELVNDRVRPDWNDTEGWVNVR